MVKQLGKFLIAGGFTVAVEYGTFLFFYFGAGLPLMLAHVVSFCLGLLTSFSLNRIWTFGGRGTAYDKGMNRQFVLYVLLAVCNLGLSAGIIQLLVTVHMPVAIAKVVVMGMVAAWNFVVYRKFIFRTNSVV